MKRFYGQIRVDGETLRFYTRCPICGRKQHGARLPLLCRSVKTLARCEKGSGGRLSQSAFNHTKANATRQLAMRFNLCPRCCRWVCDECYDSTDSPGSCRDCSQGS